MISDPDPIEICVEISGIDDFGTPEEVIASIQEAVKTIEMRNLGLYTRLDVRAHADGEDCYLSLYGYRLETPEETKRRVAASRAEFERLGREKRPCLPCAGRF